MYRNLNPDALGISGRQSEIIELALTYGYRGLEIDIEDFAKRAREHGVEQATRFISSAQIKIGGFELPCAWRGDEATFKSDLTSLAVTARLASEAGATVCHTAVLPASDNLPYHDNFELHRQRLAEIGSTLAPHGMKLAIEFQAAPAHREGREFQFVHDADAMITLLKSIGADNVGLFFDTWNWQFGGGNLDQIRELGIERILAAGLGDAPADADPAAIKEEQRTLPSDEGIVDNAGALALLCELDYEGPITLACHPDSLTGRTREVIVQKCSDALDNLWRSAGINKSGKLTPPTPASTDA